MITSKEAYLQIRNTAIRVARINHEEKSD